MAQSKEEVLVAKLLADVSAFKRGMTEAQDSANSTGKKLGKTFAKVGAAIKTGLAAGMAFLAYDAIKTIKEFDQSVANLAAVTGQSVSQVGNLKNAALDLGATTAFTANEVTGLQTELAKLGFREQDIINLTKPILNLAQATGTDLANAASLAGSVVQSFGLDASQTTQVVDVMTKSFSASALDIRKFEVGIRQVAPVAKNANVELSEVTSMLGILANNGVRAESAGVGLRNILLEAAKRGVPFRELLEDVNTSADKSARAMELFGKENAAVGVILSETVEQATQLNTALQASAGTAQEMADTQLNTLTGQLTLLTSAWDGFVLGLDNGQGTVSHVLGKLIGGATKILGAFTNNVEESTVSLADQRDEFNKQITVLQSHNLSQEAKNQVMAKINEQYADYLPNLITEKTSLGELRDLTQQVNDEFTKRIVLQSQEAKLAEQIKAITAAKSDLIRAEIRLEEIRNEKIVANEYELAKLNREEIALNSTIAYSNKILAENQTELDKLLEIQKQVRAELNILTDDHEEEIVVVEKTTQAYKDYTAEVLNAKKANENLGPTLQKIGTDFGFNEQQISKNLIKMQKTQTIAGGLESAFNSMASGMIDSLGLAENGLQGFAKTLLQTVAQIISAVIAQSVATAIVNAMQSSQATGPAALFTQPAFIATALAGVGAAIASIPKFADGGIVSGSSRYGDRVLARVNSGEMILNSGQQSNLFDMINNGGNSGTLTAKIKGSDIWLSNKRSGQERRRFTGR